MMVIAAAVALALAAAVRIGPADPVSPRCAAAERDSAMLADIRANLRTSPAVAMMQLGLSVDELEPIAHALYNRWRLAHPQTRTPAAAPAATAPPDSGARGRESAPWWCYRTAGDARGDCSPTKFECDRWRAKHVTEHFRAPCGGVPEQECVDIAAGVQGVTACEWQPRVSCFTKHFKLADYDDLACAPTIKICKARRADVLKNYADDQVVRSDCSAHD